MNKEKIKIYIAEIIRFFIILFVLYLLESFIVSLPFVKDINIINSKIFLTEVFSFLFMVIVCFIIYEFSKRTENIVDELLISIPQCGRIHSYIIYLILTFIFYFAAKDIFDKLVYEEWQWMYNLPYIAITVFYSAKIFLLVYKNAHKISLNLFDIYRKL